MKGQIAVCRTVETHDLESTVKAASQTKSSTRARQHSTLKFRAKAYTMAKITVISRVPVMIDRRLTCACRRNSKNCLLAKRFGD